MALVWSGQQAGLAAVQPDGKLLIAFHANTGGPDTYTLQRRSSSQTVDTTFGSEGSVTLSGIPVQVAVAPNGTIVVLSAGTKGLAHLAALDSTGTAVAGFDATAAVGSIEMSAGAPWGQDPFDANYVPNASALAIQADGEILVAGLEVPDGGSNGIDVTGIVTRLLADGSVDASFGSGGQVVVPNAAVTDLVLLPSGDSVVVTESTTTDSFTLTWYGAAGTPLTGVAPVGEGGYGGVLARSDSTVLVGSYQESGQQLVFKAYTPGGTVDSSTSPVVTPGLDHHFIAAGDVLTSVPITGPQLTVDRALPNGTAEAALMATIPTDAGTVTIANAIPAPDGGTLLLGQTCVSGDTNTLVCTSLVAILSSTGVLQ
jgi:hypothetical protein